jgi:hypothetical protein
VETVGVGDVLVVTVGLVVGGKRSKSPTELDSSSIEINGESKTGTRIKSMIRIQRFHIQPYFLVRTKRGGKQSIPQIIITTATIILSFSLSNATVPTHNSNEAKAQPRKVKIFFSIEDRWIISISRLSSY